MSAYWTLHGIKVEIVQRSRQSCPWERVRSLDACHMATALAVRKPSPEVRILSFDDRVRDDATALGFEVVPAGKKPRRPR